MYIYIYIETKIHYRPQPTANSQPANSQPPTANQPTANRQQPTSQPAHQPTSHPSPSHPFPGQQGGGRVFLTSKKAQIRASWPQKWSVRQKDKKTRGFFKHDFS